MTVAGSKGNPTSINVNPPLEKTKLKGKVFAPDAGKTLGTGAEHAALHKMAHKAAHSSSGLVSVLGKAAGFMLTVDMAAKAYKTVSGAPEKSESQKAEVREAYTSATLIMAERAFPKGYLDARLAKSTAANENARKLLAEIHNNYEKELKSPEKAQEIMLAHQQELRTLATEGMNVAAAQNLRSETQLNELLAKNEGFRKAYEGDIAFREGVNAGVWLAQNDETSFNARQQMVNQQAVRR